MIILDQKRLVHEYLEYAANLKEKQMKLLKDQEKLGRIIVEEIKTVENKRLAQELFQSTLDRNKEDAIKLMNRRLDFIKSALNVI